MVSEVGLTMQIISIITVLFSVLTRNSVRLWCLQIWGRKLTTVPKKLPLKRQCTQADAWRISWLSIGLLTSAFLYKQPDLCLVLAGIIAKRLKEMLSFQTVAVVLIKCKRQLLFESYTVLWWKLLQITRIIYQTRTSWFYFTTPHHHHFFLIFDKPTATWKKAGVSRWLYNCKSEMTL